MPTTDPTDLAGTALATHFPLLRPRLADDVFELGLVLGGTVSAGAYTGGVLDLLMEALDAWCRARQDGVQGIPRHRVVLSTLAGTSGGGINGALVLRAAGQAYPHGPDAGNPFYATWARGVTLQDLLSVAGLSADGGLGALLDARALEQQATASLAMQGAPLGTGATPAARDYLADPLRLSMMVTNVTGVPYRIAMTGDTALGHDMVVHADQMRFSLHVPGGMADPVPFRDDEVALSSGSGLSWSLLGDAALATSAFPLAFPTRALSRDFKLIGYRAVLVPGETPGTDEVIPLCPVWDTLRAGQMHLPLAQWSNVDGGATNNEPLDAARIGLAGLAGRNPRLAKDAHRALILVDPFSDAEDLGPVAPPGLLGMVWPLVNGLLFQARFKPADLALAKDETVYSRFLVAPVGPAASGQRTEGSRAIASGGLGGFLGFLDRSFLHYDFMLGRWNAYRFLQRHLAFPEDNTVFLKAALTEPEILRWCLRDKAGAPELSPEGKRMLPLIPLMDTVTAIAPTAAMWPGLPAMPAWLPGAVQARLKLLVDQAKATARLNWASGALVSLVWAAVGSRARDTVVGKLRSALEERGLVPKQIASGTAEHEAGTRA